MNPKANCADMAFHYPHDMQAFFRMHNVKRLPIGPHTHRGEIEPRCEFDCSRSFSLCNCGHSLEKSGQDYFISNHNSPVDAQGSNDKKYTGDFEW